MAVIQGPKNTKNLIVAKEGKPIPHDQNHQCSFCSRFGCCIGSFVCLRRSGVFNPEANVGATGSNGVGGADVDLHLGIEGNGAYAQIGPMIRVPDTGTDTEVGISGKAGYGFGPGYTELSFATIDSDTSFNLKVGGKFDL